MTSKRGARATQNTRQHNKREARARPSKSQVCLVKRKGTASTNAAREIPNNKKHGFYRSSGKIKLLNMYSKKPDFEKMAKRPLEPARIQPDRRWFGNTRVITQSKMETFREAVEKAQKDPYQVLLKRSKLPVSLVACNDHGSAGPVEGTQAPLADVLSIEPFEKTFGPKKVRKRARLMAENLSDLTAKAEQKRQRYEEEKDPCMLTESETSREETSAEVFKKGTSRRIWGELYKVIDSSDIIVQVVDARDPLGTRCRSVENHISKNHPNKHIVILLNKCDLVPSPIVMRWIKFLSKEFPTVAFRSSLTKPFGKLTLVSLLRQYASLLKDRKHVSVGFIGYPNVGKSSCINTLRNKAVCKVAPIPGETKVWQYVALTNRVHMIDCPGIVPMDPNMSDTDKVLRGVVRAEKIETPETHIPEVLVRATSRDDIARRYKLTADVWDAERCVDDIHADCETFLKALARRQGKLLKQGIPDISTAARIVLYDWQRGRIPFYIKPPNAGRDDDSTQSDAGRANPQFPAEDSLANHAKPQLQKPGSDTADEDSGDQKN